MQPELGEIKGYRNGIEYDERHLSYPQQLSYQTAQKTEAA